VYEFLIVFVFFGTYAIAFWAIGKQERETRLSENRAELPVNVNVQISTETADPWRQLYDTLDIDKPFDVWKKWCMDRGLAPADVSERIERYARQRATEPSEAR